MKDLIVFVVAVMIIIGAWLLGRLTQKPTEIRIHIDSSFCDTKEVEE